MRTIKQFLFVAMAAATIVGCKEYVPVDTFVEVADPVALTPEAEAKWGEVKKTLNGGWGSIDWRYGRSEVPADVCNETLKVVAWKGERQSAQIVLWTAKGANGVKCEIADFKSGNVTLPASIAKARFVRYTISDERFKVKKGTTIQPDMIDELDRFDMQARTTRPVWVTIDVPQDAAEGIYSSEITISHEGCGKIRLPLQVEVQKHTLATADKWAYHLDLWQHPTSVARAQGLKLWSDEHFAAMKPLMARLADAGQKVITATLNKDPWNHQCYDAYEDMIKWTKHKDGSWSYDYKVFDRWVEMMLGLGINKMINCYSMVPWNCELHYFDENEGKMVTVKAEPGKPIFPKIWEPFLKDFTKHLKAKGWLSFTNIAMDERAPEAMQAAVDVLKKHAPEMGFAIADNHESFKKFNVMRDVCVAQHQFVSLEDIAKRRAAGQNTTFYVCCGPLYPNTFTHSHPYEAEFLGWFGLSRDYDGMLRWAYNSWPADPVNDSRYGGWTSADTYLVYPENRTSIRFERLRDGIEVAEKVRQLRREGVDVSAIDAVLAKISKGNVTDHTQPWDKVVAEARAALDEASRK